MPTRLSVDIAWYHYIINRGVNRCDIYNHTVSKVIVHDYNLMDNHYHILLETTLVKRNLHT